MLSMRSTTEWTLEDSVRFNRMLATNPEIVTPDDSPVFVYTVADEFTAAKDRCPPNTFLVQDITLLANGWVLVGCHDEIPVQAFPPHRVIVLEGQHGK